MHQRKSGSVSRNNTDMYNKPSSDLESGSNMRRNGRNNTNANILEQQNNERINELSDHVARLKGLTIDIGNEVREQNSLLDNMGDGFSSTRDLLQGSLGRISTMLETTGGKHMCYLVGCAVFTMLLLYFLMRRGLSS